MWTALSPAGGVGAPLPSSPVAPSERTTNTQQRPQTRKPQLVTNVGIHELGANKGTVPYVGYCGIRAITPLCSAAVNFFVSGTLTRASSRMPSYPPTPACLRLTPHPPPIPHPPTPHPHPQFYGPSSVVSPDDYMRVAATWPASVSSRNLAHWSQMARRPGALRMYDYGADCRPDWKGGRGSPGTAGQSGVCNRAKYGADDPPTYDLSRVTAPVAIFAGEDDLMATPDDIAKLRRDWRAKIVYDVLYPKTAHMDYVWARLPRMRFDIVSVLWNNAPRTGAVGAGGSAAATASSQPAARSSLPKPVPAAAAAAPAAGSSSKQAIPPPAQPAGAAGPSTPDKAAAQWASWLALPWQEGALVTVTQKAGEGKHPFVTVTKVVGQGKH
jgi:hypothetical protein